MSQYERAVDSAVAYHQHVQRGLLTSHDHLTAAAFARQVADAEYMQAAEATSAGERRMFLTAAHKARWTCENHKLIAAVAAVGEDLPRVPAARRAT